MNKEDIIKWHSDEKEWWDKYGEYMTYQWKLTPLLNRSLRAELEKDYDKYLLAPQKNMLDIGCGAGWLSLDFMNKGMNVLGIDISREQIEAAEKLRTKDNENRLKFLCCDFVHWDCDEYKEGFDVVFVNAFLHHLPIIELESVFMKISYILKPGGKVYLYEPLECSGHENKVVNLIDLFMNYSIFVLLSALPKVFGLYSKLHTAEVAKGYRMVSPHERPINVQVLANITAPSFETLEIKAWHLYSLGFAMQSMGLKQGVQTVYSYLAIAYSKMEKVLFNIFDWQPFSKPGRFILCSVKLAKRL